MYAAVVTRPFSPSLTLNIGLGAVPRADDGRGRDPAALGRGHRPARRADRRRHRARPRQDDRRGALLGRHHRSAASSSCTASSCWSSPTSGIVMGARKGEWLRAGAAGQPVPRRRTAEALPHPRHQRHHRRPDRRRLRDRLPRRHARHPAVRAEGAAARRRLRRLAEAQPRPPRPRHPAEDPEDVRRRRHDLRHRLSRGPRSGPQADRARAHAPGEDRHQRLQPEQGRAAARRRRCSTSTSSPTRSSRSCCRASS